MFETQIEDAQPLAQPSQMFVGIAASLRLAVEHWLGIWGKTITFQCEDGRACPPQFIVVVPRRITNARGNPFGSRSPVTDYILFGLGELDIKKNDKFNWNLDAPHGNVSMNIVMVSPWTPEAAGITQGLVEVVS